MKKYARSWEEVGSPDIPPPAGAYTRGVRAGDFLFISGQVPRDFQSGELLGDTVAAQTRAVIGNLRRVLEAAGSRLGDVVSMNVYLQDIADWSAFDSVYRELFDPPYPSRTAVGATLRGILVEISAVAYTPGEGHAAQGSGSDAP
jgi:2-iminobutanoate/2-iminopropanoate deaminase